MIRRVTIRRSGLKSLDVLVVLANSARRGRVILAMRRHGFNDATIRERLRLSAPVFRKAAAAALRHQVQGGRIWSPAVMALITAELSA